MSTADGITAQIVDGVSDSATVLLDINGDDGAYHIVRFAFPMPEWQRTISSGFPSDGVRVSGTAMGGRIIELDVIVHGSTDVQVADRRGVLERILQKDFVLRWKEPDLTKSLYFLCLASPEYGHVPHRVDPAAPPYDKMELRILAQPGGLRPRVDLADETVTNSGIVNVANVQGDLPAPTLMMFRQNSGSATQPDPIVGIRQRGDPASIPLHVEAETGTTGTDTTNPGGGPDAAMAGTGTNNYLRTSFATNANLVARVTLRLPTSATSDANLRGRYAIFARLRKSVAGDVMRVQMQYAVNESPAVYVAALPPTALQTTFGGPFLVYMGELPVPAMSDPEQVGHESASIGIFNPSVRFLADRASGSTGTLDWDRFSIVPADEALAIVRGGTGSGGGNAGVWIDGPNDMAFAAVGAGGVRVPTLLDTSSQIELVGGVPRLLPGVTNSLRILLPRGVDSDVLTDAVTFGLSYYPSYAYVPGT